jgi:hypothetical protein
MSNNNGAPAYTSVHYNRVTYHQIEHLCYDLVCSPTNSLVRREEMVRRLRTGRGGRINRTLLLLNPASGHCSHGCRGGGAGRG